MTICAASPGRADAASSMFTSFPSALEVINPRPGILDRTNAEFLILILRTQMAVTTL